MKVVGISGSPRKDGNTEYIKGLDLCEAFFNECALPVIQKYYPGLKFSAGLLGYGSDVLGYDDEISTDHMWGPRFYLFLADGDIHIKDELMGYFETNLPYIYNGYSVNFSKPDINDNNVRHAEFINSGDVSPLIWIYTIDDFVNEYLGLIPSNDYEWLALSEHRLLGFTSGKLFIDMLNLSKTRDELSFYPSDVKLYLIASQWALIAEEQAFTKRCSDCNDELGSRLICTRIAERLMRLCFLYKNKYAPYSKWFGTGFRELSVEMDIKETLGLAVRADTIDEREHYLIKGQVLIANLHNDLRITGKLEVCVQKYFGRDIDVIYANRIAEKIRTEISNSALKGCPLIGSVSQVGNFVALSDDTRFISNIQQLYMN